MVTVEEEGQGERLSGEGRGERGAGGNGGAEDGGGGDEGRGLGTIFAEAGGAEGCCWGWGGERGVLDRGHRLRAGLWRIAD